MGIAYLQTVGNIVARERTIGMAVVSILSAGANAGVISQVAAQGVSI
jgi:hypothetical protein